MGSPNGTKRQFSAEARQRMSAAAKLRVAEGRGSFLRPGHRPSDKTRTKMRENHADVSGASNPNWRGGVALAYRAFVNTYEWQKFAKMVRLRDDYACRKCGRRNKRMDIHHLKSAIDFPELAFDLSNAITVCTKCHGEEHRKQPSG